MDQSAAWSFFARICQFVLGAFGTLVSFLAAVGMQSVGDGERVVIGTGVRPEHRFIGLAATFGGGGVDHALGVCDSEWYPEALSCGIRVGR